MKLIKDKLKKKKEKNKGKKGEKGKKMEKIGGKKEINVVKEGGTNDEMDEVTNDETGSCPTNECYISLKNVNAPLFKMLSTSQTAYWLYL